jgi:hypothetical protein
VDELIFIVEEAPEGGYVARGLEVPIFCEAEDLPGLHSELRDALLCHFEDEDERPRMVRLRFVRDELLTI